MEINWNRVRSSAAAAAAAIGHSSETIDDVAQETVLRLLVLHRAGRLRLDTAYALAHKTATNLSIDVHRYNKRHVYADPEKHIGSTAAPPADELLRAAVSRTLARNPALYLGAFYVLSGLTTREVGDMFGVSNVTVHKRYHHFMDAIKTEAGFGPDGQDCKGGGG